MLPFQMAWATQVQSPKLSSEGKEDAKSSKWDPSVLPPFPLPAMLLPLCPSYYITLEALSLYLPACFPYFFDQLMNLLAVVPNASLLALIFWARRWKHSFGKGSLAQGGGEMGLDRKCWASLIRKDKTRQMGRVIYSLEVGRCYSRRGSWGENGWCMCQAQCQTHLLL